MRKGITAFLLCIFFIIISILLGLLIYKFILNKSESALHDVPGIVIDLPYEFKNKKAEELNDSAKFLFENRNYEKAIVLYVEALKIEPDNPELFFNVSESLARIDSLHLAIETINAAIGLDSTFAPFYSNRGLWYYKIYENEKAIADYLKALELDNSDESQAIVMSNLVLAYKSNGEYDKACETLNKAEKLNLYSLIDKESILIFKEIKKKYCD